MSSLILSIKTFSHWKIKKYACILWLPKGKILTHEENTMMPKSRAMWLQSGDKNINFFPEYFQSEEIT